MILSRKRVVSVLVIGLFLLGFTASAAAYNDYGDFYGTYLNFLGVEEDSATDDTPLYGEPLILGEQSLFFPTAFTSESSDGSANTTSGTLTMTLQAANGFAIKTVTISEIGNYALTGSGTADTFASIIGNYVVGTQSSSILFDPEGPFALPNDISGSYSGNAVLDFTGLGLTELSFSLTNILQTQSEVGTTSYIGKSVVANGVGLEINTSPIPIPGAVWLFGSGLITLWGLRLRFTKQDNLTD